MKIMLLMLSVLFLSSCVAKAPEPAKAQGNWIELNTTFHDIKASTF